MFSRQIVQRFFSFRKEKNATVGEKWSSVKNKRVEKCATFNCFSSKWFSGISKSFYDVLQLFNVRVITSSNVEPNYNLKNNTLTPSRPVFGWSQYSAPHPISWDSIFSFCLFSCLAGSPPPWSHAEITQHPIPSSAQLKPLLGCEESSPNSGGGLIIQRRDLMTSPGLSGGGNRGHQALPPFSSLSVWPGELPVSIYYVWHNKKGAGAIIIL